MSKTDNSTPISNSVIVVIFVVFSLSACTQLKEVLNFGSGKSDTWKDIRDVLVDLADCTLPCFLGFHPDETTITNVLTYLTENQFEDAWQKSAEREFYPTLESYLKDSLPFSFSFFGFNNRQGEILVDFHVDDENLVRKIDVTFINLEWLRGIRWVDMPTILKTTPYTPEIYISPQNTISEYVIFVVYHEIGVEIMYKFDLSTDTELPAIELCFNLERTDRIQLTTVGNQDKAEKYAISPNEEWIQLGYKTVEDVFSLEANEFILKINSNPNNCIE